MFPIICLTFCKSHNIIFLVNLCLKVFFYRINIDPDIKVLIYLEVMLFYVKDLRLSIFNISLQKYAAQYFTNNNFDELLLRQKKRYNRLMYDYD